MKYEVFQIRLADSIYDAVNLLGRTKASELYPDFAAESDVSFFGSKRFKPQYLKYYNKVAEVEADGLEEVFEIGNGYGDQSKITRLARMHSVSVGDIIRVDTGRYMMVDGIGFTEVSING
jgi:hypothetical protein